MKFTQQGNILLPIVLGITLVSLLFISFKYFNNEKIPNSKEEFPAKNIDLNTIQNNSPTVYTIQENKYESDDMDISLIIPTGMNITEQFASISLVKKEQKITINLIGTNFQTTDEYFNDITVKNKISYITKEPIDTSTIKTLRKTSDQKEELTYWIYHDYGMYFVSTTDKDLYETTERVARSIQFK